MNTEKINSRIKELETLIRQSEMRLLYADTRKQEASDQIEIDGIKAELKELRS